MSCCVVVVSDNCLARVCVLEKNLSQMRNDVTQIKCCIDTMMSAFGLRAPLHYPSNIVATELSSSQESGNAIHPIAVTSAFHNAPQPVSCIPHLLSAAACNAPNFCAPELPRSQESCNAIHPVFHNAPQPVSSCNPYPAAAYGDVAVGVQSVFVAPPQLAPANLSGASRLSSQPSSGSSSTSPAGDKFQFQCPVCLKPQYTPKSHCGHVRNLLDGTGYCFLRPDVPFHEGILHCFGSVAAFVSWYVPHLRSSMGTQFTVQDIIDYNSLQTELQNCVVERRRMVVDDNVIPSGRGCKA
jgi:hypothetical protein